MGMNIYKINVIDVRFQTADTSMDRAHFIANRTNIFFMSVIMD